MGPGQVYEAEHWALRSVPDGWEPFEGRGVRRAGRKAAPGSAVLVEDRLEAGASLEAYIDEQWTRLQGVLGEPNRTPAEPVAVQGAEEALEVTIRHQLPEGPGMVHRQVYARKGEHLAILTMTAEASRLDDVGDEFGLILEGFHCRK